MPTTTIGKYVAQEFVASSPHAEILGQVLLGFLNNLRADDMQRFLKPYDLTTVDPDQWYPQQLALDVNRAIVEAGANASETLVAIGVAVVDSIPFPPEVKTIEAAVATLALISKQTTRNVPPDETMFVAAERPGYALIVANMPYAVDGLYGYLWAIARKFKPPNAEFTVKKVENPHPETHPGTAFQITWG